MKSRYYANARLRNTASVFTEVDRVEHRRRRKAIGPALADRSMRGFEPTMMAEVDTFLAQLLRSSRGSDVVEMSTRCKWLGFDIVGLLAFGSAWHTQTTDRMQYIPATLRTVSARMHAFMTWPLLHRVDPGLRWLFSGRVERFRVDLTKMITDRTALPSDAKHDLYSYIASEENIEAVHRNVPASDFWNEGCVFLTAGKDHAPSRVHVRCQGLRKPKRGLNCCNSDICRLLLRLPQSVCLHQARVRDPHSLFLGPRYSPGFTALELQVPPCRD